jgi:hypothetical protein
MSHLFGWSYPPGCSGPPTDDNDGPCEVCGEHIDNCICPECPVCGECGNPDCYIHHGLRRTEEQKFSLTCAEREWEALNFMATMVENRTYAEIDKYYQDFKNIEK